MVLINDFAKDIHNSNGSGPTGGNFGVDSWTLGGHLLFLLNIYFFLFTGVANDS